MLYYLINQVKWHAGFFNAAWIIIHLIHVFFRSCESVFVCLCSFVFARLFVFICFHVFIRLFVFVCVHMCLYVFFVFICLRSFVCAYACLCSFVCIRRRLCSFVCFHLYLCDLIKCTWHLKVALDFAFSFSFFFYFIFFFFNNMHFIAIEGTRSSVAL